MAEIELRNRQRVEAQKSIFSLQGAMEESKIEEPLHQLLLKEAEWRVLGIGLSRGYSHFLVHPPEPHVLLLRRSIDTNP